MTTSTMSTQTTNQLKSGEVIRITAATFPAVAREACAGRLVSDDTSLDQARLTINASIDGIARMMAAANKSLESAENHYAVEQADDPPLRKKRDDAASDLSQRWSEVKSHLVRRFGSTSPREYGLEGELPPTPDALARQSANAIKLLRAKPRSHSSMLGEFTTGGAADYLEEAESLLSETLKAVTVETKELHDALGRRDAAVVEWTNVYQACATLLEGFLRLGGRADLAERVRPTVRRASGLEPTPPPADPGTSTLPQPAPIEPTPA